MIDRLLRWAQLRAFGQVGRSMYEAGMSRVSDERGMAPVGTTTIETKIVLNRTADGEMSIHSALFVNGEPVHDVTRSTS